MRWISGDYQLNIFTYCFFFFVFRRRHELKTFVSAVIVTIAALDILDVARVLPVLSEDLSKESIFRHVYCSLGVFHELAIAIFLVSISVAVCVQVSARFYLKRHYENDCSFLKNSLFIQLS